MTGQDKIIELRRRGFAVDIVRIELADIRPALGSVAVSEADTPELQDWRFAYGLTAMVSGMDATRIARVAHALKPIAKRVITNLYRWPVRDSRGHPSVQLLQITDTEGLLTWQA
ncbi:hypothetical protein [Curvibacter lanceolatus]|uniref:hypothetical protein n=1 Tax=Curvibacter lanceolatus TaxID=86182 RepID=UPI00036B5527|nr:hypothetical protein [Curvibacter lanceolatus]